MWTFFEKNKANIFQSIGILGLFLVPILVFSADLSLSSNSNQYEVGDRIQLRVLVSSDASLNAVSGVVAVPTSYFAIESISKNASVLNFWVTEPTFSKGAGTARFEGVALNGFNGSGGTIISLTLRVLKAGSASVLFQTGQILANDGQGTDITKNLKGITYTLIERKSPAPEEPKPVEVPKDIPQIPTLSAPVITYRSHSGGSVITGTSEYKEASVLLTFFAQDGTKIFITGNVDNEGNFTLPVPHLLKRGYYSVNAVIIEDNGKNSETSNSLTLIIGSIFSDVGWEFWVILCILVLLVIYLLIRIFFHMKADRYASARRIHEFKQTKSLLHKSFDVLREDASLPDEKKLSAAQRMQIQVLKKDLEDAEEVMDKEIKDIESL